MLVFFGLEEVRFNGCSILTRLLFIRRYFMDGQTVTSQPEAFFLFYTLVEITTIDNDVERYFCSYPTYGSLWPFILHSLFSVLLLFSTTFDCDS